MKKLFNRILSIIMVITITFVGLPIVSATDISENSSQNTSDVSLSNGTALDLIVSNLSEGTDSEDFSIVSLAMDENTAIINVKNIKACSAIVAIYNEDTMQMYASGLSKVPVEHEEILVGINIDEMPEYYVVKAFLVDSDYAPLCKSFESLEYTKKYEDFLNCTPEDFDNDQVIIFDNEKNQADFAVLVDNAVVTNTLGNMTFKYDDKELKYTFFDAVDEVKSLEKGDVYYLKYGKKSNEFILIKVKSVSSSGSTVTVIQDSDVTLSDVFSFIRIDSQGEYDSINDDIELGRALVPVDDTVQTMSLNEEEKWIGTYEFDISSDGVVITFLKIAASDNPLEKLEEEILIDDSVVCDSGFSLSGTLEYEFVVNLKLYYDPKHMGEEYFDFNLDTHYTVKLIDTRLEGSVNLDGLLRELLTVNFNVTVGCITLNCHIAPILEISSGLEFNALNYGCFIVSANNKNGIKKIDELKKEYDVEANVEIKTGTEIGVSFDLTNILSLSLTGEFGTKCVVSADSSCMNAGKKLHHCDRCYSRADFDFMTLSLSLNFVIHPDFNPLSVPPLEWKKDDILLDEYYTSYKDGIKNGPNKGICPNILFRAKINVVSLDGESVSNAKVYCIDGICDTDGDNNYEELKNVINTDRYGTAFCYFKPGTFIVKAMSENNNYGQTKFEVIRDEVEVTIKQDEALDDIETSGTCGDNVYWEFDIFRGVLTISGNGEMIDFNIKKTPPWNSFGHHINEVVIENGVKSIGDYAFKSFGNLLNVYIADSVNRIGTFSFSGCYLLRSIHIPDSVKIVGDYAFQSCRELETAYLGKGLTKIPKQMFESCSKLSSVTMNVGLTEIGEYAFKDANLNVIDIPQGVTHIGKQAFSFQGGAGKKTQIDKIYIPETIEYIGESAFWNSGRGTEIGTVYFGGSQSRWDSLVKDYYIEPDGNQVLINANIVFNYKFDQTGYVKPTEVFTGTFEENCTWSYDSATYTLTVDGTGAMKNYSQSGSVPWHQHIPYIKKVVIKDGITHIGNCNFASHQFLKTIVLGKDIETIGDYAISGCYKLQNVNLEDCLNLTTIGVGAFSLSHGTNTDMTDVDLKPIVLPNSVRTIKDTAFKGANLVNITLNDGLESIGTNAFYFTDLEEITIPDSVKVIGDQAFELCSSLETAYLGKGITKIPDRMFRSCKSLSSVTMNVGITEIGEYAFESANLNVIAIPQGVTHIGKQAFSFQGGAGKKSQIDKIYIPETIEYIGESAFRNSANGIEIGTLYFGGTQSQWESLVDSGNMEPKGNQDLINANIVFGYNEDVSVVSEKRIRVCSVEPIVSFSSESEAEIISTDSIKNVSLIYDKCIAGNQYILLNIMDYTDDFNLTTENLCFINQLEADENGVIETGFRTKVNGDNSTVLLIGDFGKGDETVVINPSNIIDEFEITWIVNDKEFRVLAEEGTPIIKPEVLGKTGYTFTGWTPQVPDLMPAENLTFTATWSANIYNAVFDASGGVWNDGSTKKVIATAYGDTIVAPETPSKYGYVFSSWTPEIGIMDDINGKVFIAEWIPSVETTYTVETYTMNTVGEYEKSLQIFAGTTGETVTTDYSVPTGFSLNSEKSILDGTIVADDSLVLKIYLDRNTYTFTTVVDGVSTPTAYFYGSMVSEPAAPSKSGYKFIKWDGVIPETMPAENISVTAVFEKSYICPGCGNEILGEDAITEHIAAEARMKAIVKIKNNNGSNTIKYGETLCLTAITTNMPADAKIYWYIDGEKKGEGETFNVSFESETKTVEVKLVDSNGNVLKNASGNEIKDSERVTVKGGFFQKIISFFKNLFGMNRTVVQAIFKSVF